MKEFLSPFSDHSWYFRNALVRANYNNLPEGIHATTEYLEIFFENLLLNKKHELKNRYLHIDYTEADSQNVSLKEKLQNCKIL